MPKALCCTASKLVHDDIYFPIFKEGQDRIAAEALENIDQYRKHFPSVTLNYDKNRSNIFAAQ
jgi:hypothetical protein